MSDSFCICTLLLYCYSTFIHYCCRILEVRFLYCCLGHLLIGFVQFPLSSSLSNIHISFLLILFLLLLAILNKEVESNITAMFDKTLRLKVSKSKAKS